MADNHKNSTSQHWQWDDEGNNSNTNFPEIRKWIAFHNADRDDEKTDNNTDLPKGEIWT